MVIGDSSRASAPLAVAVEGPPGCGKTTYCERLYQSLCATSSIVVVPELLAQLYSCGESDRFHDLHCVSKEAFARRLLQGGIGVLMDRCRVSTVLVRITQSGRPFGIDAYRGIEERIFTDHSLSVTCLVLLDASSEACWQRRRALQPHEARIDLDRTFFERLHDNYRAFFAAAAELYPAVEIIRLDNSAAA